MVHVALITWKRKPNASEHVSMCVYVCKRNIGPVTLFGAQVKRMRHDSQLEDVWRARRVSNR